ITSLTFTTSPASITSITSLTSGTDTYSSPALSAWAVAGGGCQRDGVGTKCGFAVEQTNLRAWRANTALSYSVPDKGGHHSTLCTSSYTRTHKKSGPPFGGRQFDGAIAQRTNIETR